MKTVHLIHNPTAGDSEHSGKKLISLIEKAGYRCSYAPTSQEGWKKVDIDADIVAVAGGDGTLRKVAMAILKGKLDSKAAPLAFIPAGTANNLGRALGLMKSPAELIAAWEHSEVQGFDVGRIEGIGDGMHFLEGFGFGVVPRLMGSLHRIPATADDPAEQKVLGARMALKEITNEYKARDCEITVDGMTHSGKFLLVEIMNINALGPQLEINPLANPGDGEFEVILIPEDQRERLEAFIQHRIDGSGEDVTFSSLKGKDINVHWKGKDAHADDEILQPDGKFEINIHMHPCVLPLLLPVGTEDQAE